MKDIKEHKNFLPIDQFNQLKNLICDQDFPWRIRNKMTKTDENIYFSYGFYNKNNITSEAYREYIIPVLEKLNCKAVVQIRANLFLNNLFKKSDWHTDYDFGCNTAILYLNSCNGGTELKLKNKIKFIKAEENKLLIFNSNIYHRVCSSTDVDRRYIVNFNYF